jgi:hypothetical protein
VKSSPLEFVHIFVSEKGQFAYREHSIEINIRGNRVLITIWKEHHHRELIYYSQFLLNQSEAVSTTFLSQIVCVIVLKIRTEQNYCSLYT